MALVVRELFEMRADSYFDTNIVSLGVLPSISVVCVKHYATMIFLIILTHGIMTQVSRSTLHGKLL